MEPFVYVTSYDRHTDEIWESDGIKPMEISGAHGIFAARIPFVPAFLSDDFTRMVASESGRNKLIVGRQVRFINNLANAKDHTATFDLRFIADPKPNNFGKSDIDIVLLGKVFHQSERNVKRVALDLWRKILAHFPLEDPYNYPIEPVTNRADFDRYFEPISLDNLRSRQLVEVRKFEDHDPYMGENIFLGYFPHPFLPNLRFSALGSLMETMARQTQKCVVSISLKPSSMFKEELLAIQQMLHNYSTMTAETAAGGGGWMELHRKERFNDLWSTYWPLINQRNHVFTIKVQVLGLEEAPGDVVQALGSEFMDNTTPEPRLWAAESPGNDLELKTAINNFKYLEHKIWGKENLDPRARRLRFLVTAYEAAGAFRLPIPPESGYMPGVKVRDEAFVLPSELLLVNNEVTRVEANPVVELGEIIHRGTRTGVPFNITLRDFRRHCLIAGATGSGKTNTCLHLLSQMWTKYHIPFLVLYPIDKPDYRLLMADHAIREELLIFTLGDETVSPFRFNPFYVPGGILLKTHISQLMRSFMAAFTLWDPLPAVYREGLRRVYKKHGWDLVNGKGGDPDVSTPTMSDFYECLTEASETLTEEYGREVRGNIRQATQIRIRDLLENAGPVINVEEQVSFADILSRPTVMELGRIGSSEDIALVMGFLLTTLIEELQSSQKGIPQEQRNRQHITLVEEAHRLMSAGYGGNEFQADPRAKGGEDFSNILSEVRGFGEGIIIAEQIPTSLVLGAIGNTHVKIMHWLEDASSFNLFNDVLSLSERQREYSRTLEVGHCIVRGKSGVPTHVKVANYLDQFQRPDDSPIINFALPDGTLIEDDSDRSIKKFMAGRIDLPKVTAWVPNERTTAPTIPGSEDCEVYQSMIEKIPKNAMREDAPVIAAAARAQNWARIREICLERLQKEGLTANIQAAYCYMVHLAGQKLSSKGGVTNYEAYPFIRDAIANFKHLDK